LLFAGLLIFAACGGDDDNGSASNTQGGGTTSATRDLSGQSFTVAAVWSGAEQANFQKVLDAFDKQTGAKATFQSTGDDIATVLGTAIQGGQPPDVAVLPQPGLLRDLANQGSLTPIDDVAGANVDAHYADIWRTLGTVNGKLYGVWVKAANKSTVWYRTAAFDTAGIDPPKDWDALLKDSQTLSDAGETPWAIGGANGWVLTDWFENVYLRTAGPEKYDQLAAHQIPWTDPSVVDALNTLGDVFKHGDWIAGGASGALQTTFDDSVPLVFADNPKAAQVYEGDFVVSNIESDTNAKVGTDAKFYPFPSINGKDGVMGGGDVAVLLKDSPAGREFIKYLSTPESAEVWAPLGGFISPDKDVDTSKYPDATTRELAEQVTGAETFRFDLSDLQPAAFGGTDGQGEWKLMQDFLSNPSNAQGIAQQLESAAAQAYAK
jgi:ABC-type glycerol-3-phosphate transport system substrate-binding protein